VGCKGVPSVDRSPLALLSGYGLGLGRAIIPLGQRNGRSAMRLSNKAFKLTRSQWSVVAWRHFVPPCAGHGVPSQLNAMFCGLQDLSYSATWPPNRNGDGQRARH
jgi:hypothetical protein